MVHGEPHLRQQVRRHPPGSAPAADSPGAYTYRELFAVAEFRAIFVAQCLAIAAASAGSLALGTVTYAATGNPALTGLSIFGGPLIRLAAAWVTSSAADMLRPRQAMMAVAVVTCAADLLQAMPGLPWGARFAILTLPWIAMAATGGATLALVSDILPRDSYVFGRVLPGQARTWLIEPLRFLLAAPYVAFLLRPPLPAALVLGFLASAGYAASLPVQERLLAHSGDDVRGQVLGLYSTGVTAMQGIAAVLAGLLAQQLGGGTAGASAAMGIFGCASLSVTVALIPGLRRTRPRPARPDGRELAAALPPAES